MIKENLEKIKATIPNEVTLVAVSKTKPQELLMEAYNAGQRIFGENRIQELVDKQDALPKDIEWHMIGHLQSKKVKKIASFVSLIHAIDSFKLLAEVNKQALNNNRVIDALLQFHIAEEQSKFGLYIADAQIFLSSTEFDDLKNIRIVGVMGMATFTEDEAQIKNEFQQLVKIFKQLKEAHFNTLESFNQISMGMSGDYQIAIEQGSTMVRVGSSIFGSRL